MNVRKIVAMVVMATLLVGIAPLAALAGDDTVATPGIRASIDKAVAKSLTDNRQPVVSTRPAPRRAAAGQAVGGGGGKMMAVVAILGTVGGLATTYYVVKQMRKQTGQ